HFCLRHVVRHVAFGLFEFDAALSHCSPFTVSMMPLPHVSFDLQSAEQPSPDTPLPSSHTSPLVLSRMLSPQRCGRQFVRHVAFAAFEFDTPRSQTSPRLVSMMVSPHFGSLQVVRHGAFGVFAFAAPASHCSPLIVSVTLLPHV